MLGRPDLAWFDTCISVRAASSSEHPSKFPIAALPNLRPPKAEEVHDQKDRQESSDGLLDDFSSVVHESPNGWRVSGERRAEGDERVRCTRVLGRGFSAFNRPTKRR